MAIWTIQHSATVTSPLPSTYLHSSSSLAFVHLMCFSGVEFLIITAALRANRLSSSSGSICIKFLWPPDWRAILANSNGVLVWTYVRVGFTSDSGKVKFTPWVSLNCVRKITITFVSETNSHSTFPELRWRSTNTPAYLEGGWSATPLFLPSVMWLVWIVSWGSRPQSRFIIGWLQQKWNQAWRLDFRLT